MIIETTQSILILPVLILSRMMNEINSVPADVLNPEEETIRKQRAEFMREKVAMLKGRYRKLIELRYFEEYSYEEIAQELAIPLGTVKAQFSERENCY